ncbi:MAG: class I SAM-dependent rRNA methyltransferase [Bacillota bacterium]|nr:class I SAM-dependent rRNA methyltransferase [Bacillota bacterium]
MATPRSQEAGGRRGRPLVRISGAASQAVRQGRGWVYRDEVVEVDPEIRPGQVVRVESRRGGEVGCGFYNPRSKLAVRMLDPDPMARIDAAWFRERLEEAWRYRRQRLGDPEACRVVFAEADGLPGLIVDRYGPVVVVGFLAAGLEPFREVILDQLETMLRPEAVVERDEAEVRRHEGLAPRSGLLRGRLPEEVWIREGGVRFLVDVLGGQKTGWFLDQRENRLRAGELAAGRTVLDLFTHTGGFALQAAAGGAERVEAWDASVPALELARVHAERNGLAQRVRFREGDVFHVLREKVQAGARYQMIILDPPAFARRAADLDGAYRGYREINRQAMRLLEPGGLLITCSCSQPVRPEMFEQMLVDAAADAGARFRILERRGASPDHPVRLGHPPSDYLKCWILERM